uniref:Uncharacterized protein n=1 Tax=Lotus japonicus TaxID=34305 RepID=I3SIU3_LOTJA|nr:unknown [Lotus japonicus]
MSRSCPLPTTEKTHNPAMTERNFLRSLPDAISLSTAKARLISALRAEANCKTGSSGMCTCGIFGGLLLIKEDPLDHKNNRVSASIARWQIKVRRWYSSNSNRIHTTVATPSTVPDIFLFLHRKTSACFPPPRTW